MKIFEKTSIIQKMIVAIVLVILLFSFVLAPKAQASVLGDLGSSLIKELMQLVIWLVDCVTGLLNNMMLGVDWDDVMLAEDDINLKSEKSWLYVSEEELSKAKEKESGNCVVEIEGDDYDPKVFFAKEDPIPNMLYSPENIFGNKIAALDINFLRPNTYEGVVKNNIMSDAKEKAESKAESSASVLSQTIASWYKSFRNIAVVGLLSVLIYLGIRILISSTAADKAKYKETLRDWFIALCLVFVIHFIMAGVLMLTDNVNKLFGSSVDKGIIVHVEDPDIKFRTNLMGLIRFKTQCSNVYEVGAYGFMYIAIVIYTCIFTFMYFKRFLYMAFFTMIAPLVALTYPIDKAGDGKSQAFNMWFKEYTMNVIIQPVHLILYTVFVSSAIDLATKNLIYALVVIAFLIPAEKFIKSMFGLDKAKSTSSFGSFAGGALAMKGLQKLAGGEHKGVSGKGGKDSAEGEDEKVTFATNPNSKYGKLSTISNSGNDDDYIEEQRNNSEGDIEDNESETERNTRLEAERNMWQSMVDDPNETEQNRQDAQREIDIIDSTNTQQNNVDNEEDKKPMPKGNWQTIKGYAANKGKKYWRKKGQLARKAAIGGARMAGKAVGIVGGTMIGVGAGLTTGDVSKVFQYGAAGAFAGNAIGNKTGNLMAGTLNTAARAKNSAINVYDELYEEKYGTEKLLEMQSERQNKKAEKAFMQKQENIQRAKELKAKMNYNGDTEDIMKQMVDLEKAGIKDQTMAENIIKASYKKDKKLGGDNYEKYKDVGVFATKNGFDGSNISDQKKRDNMDDVLETSVGRKDGYKVGTTLADIYDLKSTYDKKSKLSPKNK